MWWMNNYMPQNNNVITFPCISSSLSLFKWRCFVSTKGPSLPVTQNIVSTPPGGSPGNDQKPQIWHISLLQNSAKIRKFNRPWLFLKVVRIHQHAEFQAIPSMSSPGLVPVSEVDRKRYFTHSLSGDTVQEIMTCSHCRTCPPCLLRQLNEWYVSCIDKS